MTPRVSVVIPVYNPGDYLDACVQSLLKQTLREMEFIFVDDASTDGSAARLKEAERLDERVRVITMPENSGVSAARNAGIDAALGKYVGFCDADDTADPEMYETLLNACEQINAEVSFCRVFKDRPSGTEDVPLGFPDGTRFNRAAIRSALIPAMLSKEKDTDELPLSGYTPRNLFARRTIGMHRFREDIRYAEDLLFIITCLMDANTAVAVDRAYYHYRFHAGSITKRYSSYIPESFERSNDALVMLVGGSSACMARMKIRKRKMAVDVVRNFSMIGTPFSFRERVAHSRAYLSRPDIAALYRDVDMTKLPRRIAVKYWMMKHRQAFLLSLLFSTRFRKRV